MRQIPCWNSASEKVKFKGAFQTEDHQAEGFGAGPSANSRGAHFPARMKDHERESSQLNDLLVSWVGNKSA